VKYLNAKLKIVFIPYTIIAGATILSYSFLVWICYLIFGEIPLKEEIYNVFLPFLLPVAVLFIFFRKRVWLLTINDKRGGGFFYWVCLLGTIAAPLVISVNFIQEIAFQLNEVEYVDDIKKANKEKYFKINSFNIVDDDYLLSEITKSSGHVRGFSATTTIYTYFAIPFHSNSDNIWCGVRYGSDEIGRGEGDAIKLRKRNAFMNRSIKRFEKINFKHVRYFEKVNDSYERDEYIKAIRIENPSVNASDQIILIPHFEDFRAGMWGLFLWILGSFAIGLSVLFAIIYFSPLNERNCRLYRLKRQKVKKTFPRKRNK
jgi:rhomboid protease GluP